MNYGFVPFPGNISLEKIGEENRKNEIKPIETKPILQPVQNIPIPENKINLTPFYNLGPYTDQDLVQEARNKVQTGELKQEDIPFSIRPLSDAQRIQQAQAIDKFRQMNQKDLTFLEKYAGSILFISALFIGYAMYKRYNYYYDGKCPENSDMRPSEPGSYYTGFPGFTPSNPDQPGMLSKVADKTGDVLNTGVSKVGDALNTGVSKLGDIGKSAIQETGRLGESIGRNIDTKLKSSAEVSKEKVKQEGSGQAFVEKAKAEAAGLKDLMLKENEAKSDYIKKLYKLKKEKLDKLTKSEAVVGKIKTIFGNIKDRISKIVRNTENIPNELDRKNAVKQNIEAERDMLLSKLNETSGELQTLRNYTNDVEGEAIEYKKIIEENINKEERLTYRLYEKEKEKSETEKKLDEVRLDYNKLKTSSDFDKVEVENKKKQIELYEKALNNFGNEINIHVSSIRRLKDENERLRRLIEENERRNRVMVENQNMLDQEVNALNGINLEEVNINDLNGMADRILFIVEDMNNKIKMYTDHIREEPIPEGVEIETINSDEEERIIDEEEAPSTGGEVPKIGDSELQKFRDGFREYKDFMSQAPERYAKFREDEKKLNKIPSQKETSEYISKYGKNPDIDEFGPDELFDNDNDNEPLEISRLTPIQEYFRRNQPTEEQSKFYKEEIAGTMTPNQEYFIRNKPTAESLNRIMMEAQQNNSNSEKPQAKDSWLPRYEAAQERFIDTVRKKYGDETAKIYKNGKFDKSTTGRISLDEGTLNKFTKLFDKNPTPTDSKGTIEEIINKLGNPSKINQADDEEAKEIFRKIHAYVSDTATRSRIEGDQYKFLNSESTEEKKYILQKTVVENLFTKNEGRFKPALFSILIK